MVRRLLYQNDTNQNTTEKSTNDYKDTISVSDYDLIIVDEAHRGYILDRQMSEEELFLIMNKITSVNIAMSSNILML